MRSRKEGLASLALVLLVAHATHALEPGASRRLSDVEGVPLCTESCGGYPCRFCNTNGCCSSDDRSSYCRGEPRCRGSSASPAPPAPNNNLATGLIGGGIFIVTVPTLALLLLLVYCQKKQDRRRQEARAAAAAAAAANAAVELQVPVAPASVAVGVAVPPVAVGVAVAKASSSSYNI